MSALGSSVINKSTKKFAPKAPARRAAFPQAGETTNSTRASDRRTQSQTPQPPSTAPSGVVPAVSKDALPNKPADGRSAHSTERRSQSASIAVQIPAARSVERGSSVRSTSSRGQGASELATGAQTVQSSHSPANLNTQNQAVGSSVQRSTDEDANAGSRKRKRHTDGTHADAVTNTRKRGRTGRKGNETTPHEPSSSQTSPTTDQVTAEDTTAAPAPAKKATRSSRKAKASASQTSTKEADTGDHESQPAAATEARKSRKRESAKKRLEDAAVAIVQDAVNGASKDPTKRKKRTKRSVTPDDAESQRIAPSEIRMSDLCKDTRTGKKSAREMELRELDRAAFVKKKQSQLREMMDVDEAPVESAAAEASEPQQSQQEDIERTAMAEEVALNVPNTVIVNGQIQIDMSSLRIDRHAAAAVERDATQMEGVEESELTRRVNAGSWLKKERSGSWNTILLERFYDGLRMFGTDFGMISKMFPGKSRHAIKLKFVREERYNPAKIKATLLGEQLPVDLEDFQQLSGTVYGDPEVLSRQMEEDRKVLEDQQAAEQEALEKVKRDRAEQAAAEREANTREESDPNEATAPAPAKKRKSREKAKPASRTKARKLSRSQSAGDRARERSVSYDE